MIEDLPLALRRGRRASLAPLSHDEQHQQQCSDTRRTRSSSRAARKTVLCTPSRGQKKRVRFSDPRANATTDDATASLSTGLTPSLRRTTLLSPGSSTKRRRRLSTSDAAGLDNTEVQVTFLPLRQVIDGRVKRRIRRNGLSEEMNVISAEKRRKAQQNKADMEALRAEVAAKDAQIRRLSGATISGDMDCDSDVETEIEGGRDNGKQRESIDDLKRQVEQLRNALKSPAPSSRASSGADAHIVGWNEGAGDYYHSDMDLDLYDSDEDGFGDSTIDDLVCSTPSRRPSKMRHSFPTPPSTGSPPPRLRTPCSDDQQQPHTSPCTSNAAVQVQLSDDEKRELEEELASLHLEIDKLTSTLETYESVTSRLSDKLAPFIPQGGGSSAAEAILASRSPAVRVEVQLNNLLKTFASRSAALEKIDSSLQQLGFAGSNPAEILASLSASFRSVRLELEYLTPGEIAIPLTSSGAAVLDMLLCRLRELSRQGLEDQGVISEYQHLEISLRKQLVTRVEAMDDMRAEITILKDKVKLRNMRIRELETGVDKLKASVKTYTRDISELETLAQRLEADLDTANKSLSSTQDEASATQFELEEKLSDALAHTSSLKEQMEILQRQQRELCAKHAEDRVERDALKSEVEGVNHALRSARETIRKLEVEKGVLSERLGRERSKARAAVEAMKVELDKAFRMGEDLLASPRSDY